MKLGIISEVFAFVKDNNVIAGAAGGALRWNTLKEDFKSGIISVISGAIMAVYLTEAMSGVISGLLKLVGIIAVVPPSSSAFIVGVCGTTIISFVLDFITIYRKRISSQGEPK